jgi:pimeloyl-ACP methyl ester carboxylesterase
MEHVDVGAVRIGFRRAGRGPALLLLHGGVADSRVWSESLDRLAEHRTVIAWDAPGCGGSSDPPGHFGMADFADCLAAFADALQIEEAHVLGQSWGSTLALELCLRRPSLVRSLTLVGGYAGWAGSLPPDEVAQRLRLALDTADAIEAGEWDPESVPGLFTDAMSSQQRSELLAIMSEIRATGTRVMARALAESDVRPEVGAIDTPTLVLAGERDERSPVEVAERLHRAIRGSRLTVLPGLGHECYLEDPAAFHDAVRDFLDIVERENPPARRRPGTTV